MIACGITVGCADLTLKSKSYPFLITKPVEVSPEGAILSAEVLDVGTAPVTSFGFMLNDTEVFKLVNAIKLNQSFAAGAYSVKVSTGLEAGKTYYMKPFAQTADHVVFGDLIKFEAQGSLPPKILSFSPAEGPIGSRVEIRLNNLGLPGTLGARAKVYFGNALAKVDSVAEGVLYVPVPVVTQGGPVPIKVEIAGMQDTANGQFDIWFPWTQLADFPGTYMAVISSFVANDKLYVLGGLRTNPWQVMNEFWVYDPAINQWQQKAPFPGTARYGAVSFSCNNKGYYGLGRTETQNLNDLWEYDPATSNWTRKADFPAQSTDYPASFEIQNKGYVDMQYPVNYTTFGEVWEYDPQLNQWTQVLDAPTTPIYKVMSSATANFGCVALGSATSFYKFDPLANTWTQLWNQSPFVHWQSPIGCLVNENIYIGLGTNQYSTPIADFWNYNIAQSSWTQMHPCPKAFVPMVHETIGNKAYFGYGYVGMYDNQSLGRLFYVFDPAKN